MTTGLDVLLARVDAERMAATVGHLAGDPPVRGRGLDFHR
jgi:hypothetical protein